MKAQTLFSAFYLRVTASARNAWLSPTRSASLTFSVPSWRHWVWNQRNELPSDLLFHSSTEIVVCFRFRSKSSSRFESSLHVHCFCRFVFREPFVQAICVVFVFRALEHTHTHTHTHTHPQCRFFVFRRGTHTHTHTPHTHTHT